MGHRTAVERALALAWEAYGRGTVPVGAVVSDGDGTILFEGRSRMYELSAPPGELANSLLAHAEINALSRLDPVRRHEGLTITSTLEPCPLCYGAIGMATVGTLVYLGADPYGGAVGTQLPTPHVARVPLRMEGPSTDAIGLLASALHVAFYLQRNPNGQVVSTHRRLAPHILAAATQLHLAGAQQAATRGDELKDFLPELSSVPGLSPLPEVNMP